MAQGRDSYHNCAALRAGAACRGLPRLLPPTRPRATLDAVPADPELSAASRAPRLPGRELSDERLVSQSRLIALGSTLPVALTGSLSLYVATQGSGRGDAAPWLIALGSALVILAVRFSQRHQGRVFITAEGVLVRTLFGTSVVVAWREIEGARVGFTPWGVPSRYPGYVRLRLRTRHPIVGRWVTTIAPTRDAALRVTAEIADRVREAL